MSYINSAELEAHKAIVLVTAGIHVLLTGVEKKSYDDSVCYSSLRYLKCETELSNVTL